MVTADLFHGESHTLQVKAGFVAPNDIHADGAKLLALLDGPHSDAIRVSFGATLHSNHKAQIHSVYLGENRAIFQIGSESASLFPFLIEDRIGRQAGLYSYRASHAEAHKLFGLLDSFLQRVVYFPAHRQPRLGSDTDMGGLAGGEGLVSWIEYAANPDPKDADSARRHGLLQEFQQEFAEFIGSKSVSLSVPKYSLPLQNNEQITINATIDGRLRLLSQLGAGIGESLIVLLVAKLSQEWRNPPIDVVLLEEPELHIHPSLQRRLLDKLSEYGVQLIVATHSPAVVNWFARSGARIFRTEFEAHENRVVARQMSGLTDLRGLIESIGASPADIVLADKVLLVEGSNDVPVFKAWLAKAPSYGGQNVAILALGGSDAASSNFDPEQWRSLHPKIGAMLDSERKFVGEEPPKERQEIKGKLERAGIRCHLTAHRATENYFTERALKLVYGGCPNSLDRFGDPNLANQGVKQFSKSRNGEVAQAMEWAEIETTDIGARIEDFLKS